MTAPLPAFLGAAPVPSIVTALRNRAFFHIGCRVMATCADGIARPATVRAAARGTNTYTIVFDDAPGRFFDTTGDAMSALPEQTGSTA